MEKYEKVEKVGEGTYGARAASGSLGRLRRDGKERVRARKGQESTGGRFKLRAIAGEVGVSIKPELEC